MARGRMILTGPSGFVCFKVVGPLDASGAIRLKPRLLHAVEDGYRHLVLDSEFVPYIDSEGLKMLIEVMSRPGEPVQIEMVGANRSVSRVFSLTRLGDYFPVSVRP
ncbi:MAG: STAS domain-containing protein [Armatimonadetes bacterium]|nr:STAS domain-containing protein [Armatimonadota bacterium]